MLRLVLSVLAILFAGAASAQTPLAPPASPPAETAPSGLVRCMMGFYLSDLYEIDTSARSFGAELYAWSRCSAPRDPLATVDFLNANDREVSLPWSQAVDGGLWSTVKVVGQFRQGYDLTNYPFDRHTLTIVMEEGTDSYEYLAYAADAERSRMREGLFVQGWRLSNFRVEARPAVYETAFGDPSLPSNAQTRYAHLEVSVDVRRADLWTFWQLSFPIFVATSIALLSFLMHDERNRYLTPRLSLLAGVLFALVLNMRAASEEVGLSEGLTLLDKMHLLALVLVFAAVVISALWNILAKRGLKQSRVERWDRWFLIVGSAVFILGNSLLVGMAAIAG